MKAYRFPFSSIRIRIYYNSIKKHAQITIALLSSGNNFKWVNNLRNKLYLKKRRMAYYQHNMLSIKSRTLLANILAEVVLLSESIEAYREALAQIDYFDCIALFRFLDREEKGYLR